MDAVQGWANISAALSGMQRNSRNINVQVFLKQFLHVKGTLNTFLQLMLLFKALRYNIDRYRYDGSYFNLTVSYLLTCS